MLFNPKTKSELIKMAMDIDPVRYAKTRNFINGGVTHLSPYISRGVLSTREIMVVLQEKGYAWSSCETLLKELAWRDYFQRVQQHHPDLHRKAIKQEQTGVASEGVPLAVVQGQTGIDGIDRGIQGMLDTGYMHNHQRMYTAMLCCNIGQFHWKACGDWLYYHLIDGDVASNYCSWQWTAGAFSSKRYIANQENINHYTNTHQKGTYLDDDYEALREMPIPSQLRESHPWQPFHWSAEALKKSINGSFPAFQTLEDELPVVLYNSYQLSQEDWVKEPHHKVLLLEPSFFQKFPISPQVMDWILSQAALIDGLICFVGEWDEWSQNTTGRKTFFLEHPLFAHYQGTRLEREWMFPEVNGYYPSFFSFWKQVEKRYTW
jgi:deoxyribodipyrimidine photo-lyase